jgi:hypothetical protein
LSAEKESGTAPIAAEASESVEEPEEESTDEPAATEDETSGGVDDDLELAWQMLEHARLIYEQDQTTNAEALAEVHEMLGNISMENGIVFCRQLLHVSTCNHVHNFPFQRISPRRLTSSRNVCSSGSTLQPPQLPLEVIPRSVRSPPRTLTWR